MADPKKATEYRKINDELVQVWPETVTDNITVKNYTKPSSTSAIASDDLLNTALGKLEKALDGKQAAGNYVPTTRKVNNKALSADITLTYSDVGAAPTSHAHGNITNAGELETASRVVITDANKKVTTSTITTTELGYLSGVSSNLQTQINNINTSVAGGITIKGTIGTNGTITALPATHKVGDAYYAVVGAPQIGDYPTENGDMIVCITAGTSADNTHWSVIQNNTDTMVGATASATGKKGLVPSPAAGDQNKVLAGNGTWVVNTGDTHHQAKNIIGTSATATANGAATNPYLNLIENGSVRSTHHLSGTSPIGVASDANGNVTVTHGNSGVTAQSYGPTGNATPGYGATFNVPQLTVDAKGHITSAATYTVKIPASDNTNTTYTLSTSTASNTVTITPSSGSAQTKDLPTWASYGTSLPNATAVAAMPDGALFLLLDA